MKNKNVLWVMMVVACAAFMNGSEPVKPALPSLSTLAAALPPNGVFVISVERQGQWQEAGRLPGDRFLREQRLDLAPWLDGAKEAHVRIRQQGGGASHLDAVLLDGSGPVSARNSELDKIGRRDNDLATATDRTVDLKFAVPAGKAPLLAVTGRIENKVIATEPFQFPTQNTFSKPSTSSSFYSYNLGSAAPPRQRFAGRAWLAEVGQRQPFFSALSQTGSGHPTGTTYGWVSNDERNLYVTIDFTPDNTFDDSKDYAKVFVRGKDGLREFKVSVPERRWGRAHFVYTDKVAYQHKVYDFAIPLAGLPRNADGGLDLSFAAYGTASPMSNFTMNLAHDPNLRRYLLVMSFMGQVVGVFFDEDGNLIAGPIPIAIDTLNIESDADVAYDRINRYFMVTWKWVSSADGTEQLRATVLNDDGSVHTPVFLVMSTSDHLYSPTLAFDDVNQQYLLAWVVSDDEDFSWVRGQRRDSTGFLVGGLEIDISPNDDYAGMVDLAFDSQSRKFMAVWDHLSAFIIGPVVAPLVDEGQIGGQMINADDGTLSGGPFSLSTGENANILPTVANDAVNHRFLAAWVQMSGTNLNSNPASAQRRERLRRPAAYPALHPVVTGRLFDSDGAPLGGDLGIGLKPNAQFLFPRLAHDPVHGRYLAVWYEWEPPVFPDPPASFQVGQFLDNNGTAIGTDPAENFVIGGPLVPFTLPPLACNTVCGNFMTLWLSEDEDVGYVEIIGGGCPVLPAVETLPVSAITTTGAQGGGNVSSDGGANVFSRGVCWNTTGDPTIADPHSSDGGGLGIFSSTLSGLLPGTTYHVRAFASNSVGTAYGGEVVFTTFRWQVTFLVDTGGTLVGPTPQYVNTGGDCLPVEAVAKTGYFFRKWEGSNSFSSLANPLIVTNVASDLTFNARIGTLGLSVTRRVEKAWIITSQYADIQLDVSGLAASGAARFLLLRKVSGGGWEAQKEILPGDFVDGRYTFASLPLDKDKQYSFRVEAYSASGVLLGKSAEVTI